MDWASPRVQGFVCRYLSLENDLNLASGLVVGCIGERKPGGVRLPEREAGASDRDHQRLRAPRARHGGQEAEAGGVRCVLFLDLHLNERVEARRTRECHRDENRRRRDVLGVRRNRQLGGVGAVFADGTTIAAMTTASGSNPRSFRMRPPFWVDAGASLP